MQSCNKPAGPGSCPSVNKCLAHLVLCAALGTPLGWGGRSPALLSRAGSALSMLFPVSASFPSGRSHRVAGLWGGSTQSSPGLPLQRPLPEAGPLGGAGHCFFPLLLVRRGLETAAVMPCHLVWKSPVRSRFWWLSVLSLGPLVLTAALPWTPCGHLRLFLSNVA